MKRKITLSIALVLSLVLISLTASDSTVRAQQQQRAVFDSGMVTLGANQALRVSIVGDWNSDGSDTIGVRFRQTQYTQGVCGSGGVCKYSVASQSTTAPITLTAGEAASQTLVATTYGRSTVFLSTRRNVRVTAAIIDTVTGETVTQIIMANTEGD